MPIDDEKCILALFAPVADETFMISVGKTGHVIVHCEIGLYNREFKIARSRRVFLKNPPPHTPLFTISLACDNKCHIGQTGLPDVDC